MKTPATRQPFRDFGLSLKLRLVHKHVTSVGASPRGVSTARSLAREGHLGIREESHCGHFSSLGGCTLVFTKNRRT